MGLDGILEQMLRPMIASVTVAVAQLDGDDMRSSGRTWFGFRYGDVIDTDRRGCHICIGGHISRRRCSSCR